MFLIFSLLMAAFFKFFALVYIKWLIVNIVQTTISLQKLLYYYIKKYCLNLQSTHGLFFYFCVLVYIKWLIVNIVQTTLSVFKN